MKAILLCGGNGTRLYPLTSIVNKHLIGIYNRPMITYPIETIKALGIEDVLLVSGGNHMGGFAEFLNDGSAFGINLTYKIQKAAGGIAEALGLAEDFAHGQPVVVVLGDNLFDNEQFEGLLDTIDKESAYIFLKDVPDPQRFGVPTLDGPLVVNITEKPASPASQFAVTGLYYYPNEVFDAIRTLVPSGRGEKEITDVNNYFIAKNKLNHQILKGYWGDAGTFSSLLNSSIWAEEKFRLDK